jgi:competence protein ComEC
MYSGRCNSRVKAMLQDLSTSHATPAPEPGRRMTGLHAAPFFHAAWLFAAGILLSHWFWWRPGWLLLALLLLALLFLIALWRARRMMLPVLAIFVCLLGALSAELEPQPAPSSTISDFSDGLLRTVEGTVVSVSPLRDSSAIDSAAPEINATSQRVDIQVAAIEEASDSADWQRPVQGGIRLMVHWPKGKSAQEFRCGEKLRVALQLELPDDFHDPDVWSRSAALLDQGITSTGRTDAANVERLGIDQHAASITCRLATMQHTLGARLQELPARMRNYPSLLRLSSEDTSMLAAMVAGDRSYLTRSLRVGFERTGSFHMLVVSGFHLAVIAGIVFWLARRLHLPNFSATLLTITAAILYAFFTGFATPVQRSLWMVIVYLTARLVNRRRSPLNAIGLAALTLFVISPRSLFEASLQMSLLSVVAIAAIAAPMLGNTIEPYRAATHNLDVAELDATLPLDALRFRLRLRELMQNIRRQRGPRSLFLHLPQGFGALMRLTELVIVALIVEIALSLPMAIYFHRFTLFAIPTNLLLMPLLLLLIPAAMVTMLCLAIWPALATIPAMATALVLHMDLAFVRLFSTLRLADMRTAMPLPMQITLFFTLLAVASALAPGGRWMRRAVWLCLLAAIIAAVYPRPIEHPRDALLFEAIDVGQGDSLLLITPEGKTLLIDGGGFGGAPQQSTQDFDIGEEVVSSTLWARGIRHLDAVALTHAHSDHMGGLPAILKNFQPDELWIGKNPEVPEYKALLSEARALGVKVRPLESGTKFSFGSIEMQVYAPLHSYTPGDAPVNDDSLVLRASYGQSSVFLEGDAEAPLEDAMLNEETLSSTVLKVGHHGSNTSTQPQFLSRVAPKLAVISCGLHNRYGHPRSEVLEHLQSAGVRTFRTDIGGAQCFVLDGRGAAALEGCSRGNGN